jgi:hypothetical protein
LRPRPCGITALGVVYLFLGGVSLLWSLIVFGFGSVSWLTGSLFGGSGMATSGGASVWAGLLGLLTAGIQIIAAIGLLQLKPWAWVLALIAVGVTVTQGILGMFSGGLAAFCCGGFGVLLPIGILTYLLSPGTRAAFQRGAAPDPVSDPIDVYIASGFTPMTESESPQSSPEPLSLPPPDEPANDL